MSNFDTEMYFADFDRDCETAIIPMLASVVPKNAFRGFSRLKTVIMHDGITSIGFMAFKDCRSLEYISLPDSVTKIDDGAFAYCRSLYEIRLSNGLKEIGGCAFVHCALKSIVIPESVNVLGYNLFRGCHDLETVTLPDTVKVVSAAQKLFENCDSLKRLSVCADCKVERGSILESCRIIYRKKS